MVATKRTAKKKAPITNASAANKATVKTYHPTEICKRYSKTEIINELAANTGLNRRQIGAVLNELSRLVHRHIKKRAVGKFVLAGLIRISTVEKPAKKARKGINPFTGKEAVFEAKPATTAVKVYALKGLKDMAN